MPHRNVVPQLIAGGTINPACFVKVSASANNTGLAATAGSGSAGDTCIGITEDSTYQPPGVLGAATSCVISGMAIPMFGVGDVCNLVAGTGGFTAGDPLKSDANANGITATSAGTDIVCAIALETTPAGQKGRVQIVAAHKL